MMINNPPAIPFPLRKVFLATNLHFWIARKSPDYIIFHNNNNNNNDRKPQQALSRAPPIFAYVDRDFKLQNIVTASDIRTARQDTASFKNYLKPSFPPCARA